MFTPPDHGRGPEVAGPARIRYRAMARRLRRAAVGSLCAVASSLCLLSVGAMAAHADNPSETPLALENGWTNAPYDNGLAKVEMGGGIVSFSGAIATSGTNPVAFTLPAALRPAYNVFVPVDMCNGTNGRLEIAPSGDVTVEAQNWANAQCFTSLDGVSFISSDLPPSPQLSLLSLQNGWTAGPCDTNLPQAIYVGGTVEFQGAMATSGTNPVAFTLPPALRPQYTRYVPVDMCSGTNGRLAISPSGVVTVEAEGGAWGNAGCFTSLDGVSFIE